MDRRRFLLTSLAGTLAVPLAAEAQPPTQIGRVGFLAAGRRLTPAYGGAFIQAMAALGWVEGRDVVIETRMAEDRLERMPDLANDLVRAQVDVIVAPVNAAIEAAKRATSTIPIVMVSALDPVRRGYIKSLAKPGGNVTGLTWDVNIRLSAKYVDLLRERLPRLSTVGGLMEPGYGIEAYAEAFEEAAERTGLCHPRFIVHRREDLPGAFAEMERQRVEAVRIYGSAAASAPAPEAENVKQDYAAAVVDSHDV